MTSFAFLKFHLGSLVDNEWEGGRKRKLTLGIEMVQSRDLEGMESRITWEGELTRSGKSLDREK